MMTFMHCSNRCSAFELNVRPSTTMQYGIWRQVSAISWQPDTAYRFIIDYVYLWRLRRWQNNNISGAALGADARKTWWVVVRPWRHSICSNRDWFHAMLRLAFAVEDEDDIGRRSLTRIKFAFQFNLHFVFIEFFRIVMVSVPVVERSFVGIHWTGNVSGGINFYSCRGVDCRMDTVSRCFWTNNHIFRFLPY